MNVLLTNITVGVLCVIVLGIGVWSVWNEYHGGAPKNEEEDEEKNHKL